MPPRSTVSPIRSRLPVIRLVDGELPRVVDEAETALIAAGRHVYQRGEFIVHPIQSTLRAANDRYTSVWHFAPITKSSFLVDVFTCVAQFERFSQRVRDYVRKDCPKEIAEVYLSRLGS